MDKAIEAEPEKVEEEEYNFLESLRSKLSQPDPIPSRETVKSPAKVSPKEFMEMQMRKLDLTSQLLREKEIVVQAQLQEKQLAQATLPVRSSSSGIYTEEEQAEIV